ncbi:MAG: hypothetical protein JWQ97_351 [Phenylobacterium sp.]|nr:hypothetical protein [Phenylobacterium sp.]
MSKTDALEARRSQAADAVKAATKAVATSAAVTQMRKKALDLTGQAKARAREEVARRRSSAAVTLESLADALRGEDPQADARARRKTLAVAGGSGLALTVAVGIGVALGFALSRQLKKRPARQVGTYFSRQPRAPHGQAAEGDDASTAAGFEDLNPEDSPEPVRPPDANAVQAAERMDSDYRERLQAGSDL